ncbi:MAG: glycerophosphodiester phosphodiesterase [Bacilli bacterium]|nr:glycerophosphodiester phosphodiesterase [Bacilli bacterium]
MKIIAHRAHTEKYKDNSLKSILYSLNQNYIDGIEIDIRMTKDFKFVLNHDPFYKGHYIKHTSLKTLKKIGLNSLNEVLSKIKSNKIILIEIKEETGKYRILVSKLYKTIKKYNLNIYIFSFNYNLMKYLKNKYPNLKCGLLIGIKKNLNKLNNDLDFNAVNYRHSLKTPNKLTFIWTVNNIEELKKIKKGQNIITDRPKYFYNLF